MNIEELFFKLLKFRSVTPNDDGCMDFVASYLNEFEFIRIDKEDTKNLFLYKKFGDKEHLSFAGHIDVVPAGDGWITNPFEPILKDGFVYARGSQDMKSGVAAFLKACKDTKDFKGTLSLILTSDEEGEAKHGTIEVLKYLEKENFLPDFCVVAEPTCDKKFGDSIKIGRRGSNNGYLTIKGLGGHAAYPEKSDNPVHKLAPKLNLIAGAKLDEGDKYFDASRIIITDIRGGMEVTNVTPNDVKIMFNVRNSTKTSNLDIENYVKNAMQGLNYELKVKESSKPFLTDSQSKIVRNISQSIEKVLNIKPNLSTKGGTSDARFLSEFGVKTVEFGTLNDSIHAPNEKVYLKDVEKLYEVFLDLIENFN